MLSPCKNCPSRKVGCHNVETCQKWREYVEANQAAQAKRRENSSKNEDWHRHLKRRGYTPPMK